MVSASAQRGIRRPRFAIAVATAVMTVAALYFLIPVYWLVVASTKSAGELFTTPGFTFSGFHLFDNIAKLTTFEGGIFWRWMLNSVVYSVFGSVLTTLVCALAGYALSVYRFRARQPLIALVLGSLLIPGAVLAIPTYQLIVLLGLDNTYAGLLLPGLVFPFGVLLAYVYAQSSIPYELIEAARIDGLNELRIFLTVGMRMMSTGLATILLFAFLGSWNSFILPLLVLNDTHLMPLTVGLHSWNANASRIPGLQALTVVGALVSVVPIVAVFLSLQRFWKTGLATGSVRF
ncbi:carbohydrate ABC transporter permease [Micromonospora sp. 067-2]|uniref:carbohydrate ABC transporter permease n=1 Tax=Micromonospora sp. 067-2 TaxID=2789270 RepID=UPI003978CFDE